jgi:hypothetical protein
MSNRNLPENPSVASLVKGRDIADTLRVLEELRGIELVGPRQSMGDHVARSICDIVARCNHRHDVPGSVREVAGAGWKRSHDEMDVSASRSKPKVAKREGDSCPAARRERGLRQVFLGYRVDTGILLIQVISPIQNIH